MHQLVEWEDGSARWADEDGSAVRPSWAQTDTPQAQEGLQGWGGWFTSQRFISERLQHSHEPVKRLEDRQLQTVEPQEGVVAEPVERDAADQVIAESAAALIRKASEENGEAILSKEAAALEPMRAFQSGAARGQRAVATAVAADDSLRKQETMAAAAAEAKELALEAQGFVRKGVEFAPEQDSTAQLTDDVTAASQEAAEAEARALSYTSQSFSRVGDTFAGGRVASWGGMLPDGLVPVSVLGYPSDTAALTAHRKRTQTAAAPMRARLL